MQDWHPVQPLSNEITNTSSKFDKKTGLLNHIISRPYSKISKFPIRRKPPRPRLPIRRKPPGPKFPIRRKPPRPNFPPKRIITRPKFPIERKPIPKFPIRKINARPKTPVKRRTRPKIPKRRQTLAFNSDSRFFRVKENILFSLSFRASKKIL